MVNDRDSVYMETGSADVKVEEEVQVEEGQRCRSMIAELGQRCS